MNTAIVRFNNVFRKPKLHRISTTRRINNFTFCFRYEEIYIKIIINFRNKMMQLIVV
jgi:hypothetical protein